MAGKIAMTIVIHGEVMLIPMYKICNKKKSNRYNFILTNEGGDARYITKHTEAHHFQKNRKLHTRDKNGFLLISRGQKTSTKMAAGCNFWSGN